MSFDSFLEEDKPRSRIQFLKSWKERGYIDVWLHTKVAPVDIWRHSFPKLITRDNVGMFKQMPWNCLESKETLRTQYFRNRDDGSRQYPPVSCPFCKMTEWLRSQVQSGKMDFLQTVFLFPGADGKDIVYHAQGIFDGFKDVTDEQKSVMRSKRVYQKEGWRESLVARKQYIFSIVDQEHPELGLQMATEASSLGDKTRTVLKDIVMKYGAEEGSYESNPYCMRWKYDESQDFNNRYHVLDMPKVKASDVVMGLITSSPPDLSMQTKPMDVSELRSLFERYLQVQAPIDEWFPKVATASKEKVVAATNREPVVEYNPPVPLELPVTAPIPKAKRTPKKKPEEVACDECGKMMLVTDKECPHCGVIYEDEPSEDNIPF